jgi:hypothetical protein
MWMDAYVQEILIRERIAESARRAARHHLLHHPRSPRDRQPRLWERLLRFIGAPWTRPTKRLEEVTSP